MLGAGLQFFAGVDGHLGGDASFLQAVMAATDAVNHNAVGLNKADHFLAGNTLMITTQRL